MRTYTSRRISIVKAMEEVLTTINGQGDFRMNVQEFSPKLKFWDEIKEFPAIHLSAGSESRNYIGGGASDRFMSVTIRCYVQEENSQEALEALLEDVETVLNLNGRLAYFDSTGAKQYTRDIKVTDISTDEGVLDPIGIGEIVVEVSY